jgi:hypothetical protein
MWLRARKPISALGRMDAGAAGKLSFREARRAAILAERFFEAIAVLKEIGGG